MGEKQMKKLANLWSRGAEFLGCEYAIMGGAMSWVSERNLVSAISNAGGFGVIACSSMTPDLLRNEIRETKKLLVQLYDKSWLESIHLATEANAKMRETADFKKGLQSFIDKEKLTW